MIEPDRWFTMTSAPKDGSRFLVTVCESEQRQAQVDVGLLGAAGPLGREATT